MLLVMFLSNINAQSVNILLKNNKIVNGTVVKEEPVFLIIRTEIGELKILRQNIESISYKSFEDINTDDSDLDQIEKKNPLFKDGKTVLNDIVVIYLKNEEIISGKLIAKSLDMILVTTEAGNLTIPKKEIKKIEYVSNEFAERGAVVIAHLANGSQFEGNIFFEDYQSLILDTKIGKLTIEKSNLRSIEYTGEQGKGQETLVKQFSAVALEQPARVDRRLDILTAGYTPIFGPEFSPGFSIGYSSKFLLTQMEGLYISAIGGIDLHYFLLNQDFFADEVLSVSASGGLLITTISGGAALTLFQNSSSNYEFYISPQLEANIVYKTLKKDYPSYPAHNLNEVTTSFVFGVRNKIGLDFLLDNSKVGISYDMHFLFGEEDYNTISFNFTTQIF